MEEELTEKEEIKAIRTIMLSLGAKLLLALIEENEPLATKIDQAYHVLGEVFPEEFEIAQKSIDKSFEDRITPDTPTALEEPLPEPDDEPEHLPFPDSAFNGA